MMMLFIFNLNTAALVQVLHYSSILEKRETVMINLTPE